MLRNASSTLPQQRTLSALCRTFSSSPSCSNAYTSGEAKPKPVFTRALGRTGYDKDSANRAGPRDIQQFSRTKRVFPVTAPNFGPKKAPRYKVPSKSSQPEDRRLLRPSMLADRVKAAADSGSLDDAVLLVKNAPIDAQNVIVWNTLLSEAMRYRRYKLAYSLFNDMKRRGFVPGPRTFSTLLRGYVQVEDWSVHTQQIQNVHSLYDGWMELVETLRLRGAGPGELVNYHTNMYLAILGKAGLWQRFFDIYNTLSTDELPFPDQFTYTAVLEALGNRRHLPGLTDSQVHDQNASDVKLIWRQMVKASAKLGFPIDSHLICSALKILARGTASDQLFAFDIVREYVGFAPPGEPPVKEKTPMSPFLLEGVLQLCWKARKFSLCLHYLRQAMEKYETLVHTNHCDIALQANAMQAAMGSLTESSRALEIVEWMLLQDAVGSAGSEFGRIRPKMKTFRYAMVACWRGGDWETAMRIFERLTHYVVANYSDKGATHSQRMGGKRLDPDVSIISLLTRTALVSGEPANMRQCLRLVNHIGQSLLEGNEARFTEGWLGAERETPYYAATCAQGIIDLVNAATKVVKTPGAEEGSYTFTQTEMVQEQWERLKRTAKKLLRVNPRWQGAPQPLLEETNLGSVQGLSAVDAHVDYTMTKRHIKSA